MAPIPPGFLAVYRGKLLPIHSGSNTLATMCYFAVTSDGPENRAFQFESSRLGFTYRQARFMRFYLVFSTGYPGIGGH